MLFNETVFVDSLDMGFGAVTDVLIETVFWVFSGELYHVLVASDFGDDGGGGDFADFGVGFDASGSEFF